MENYLADTQHIRRTVKAVEKVKTWQLAVVLLMAVFVTPVFAGAIWIGSKMFSRSNEQIFRYVCYGLIAMAALIGLPVWDSMRG